MTLADYVSISTNVVIAVAAALALYVGWRQVGISREISAIEAYENYHVLCLQYPKFSIGRFEFEDTSLEELDSYTVFVLYTLMTGERIYALFPKDLGWIFSIEEDIRIHRRFIESRYFEYHLNNQRWQIKPLIDRVLKEPAEPGHIYGWARSIATHGPTPRTKPPRRPKSRS